MKRVIFDTVLFIAVFILPWWITIPLAIIGLFVFNDFYEFIIVGIIIFAVFRAPGDKIITSPLWYSLITLILFFGIQQLKKVIIFYK